MRRRMAAPPWCVVVISAVADRSSSKSEFFCRVVFLSLLFYRGKTNVDVGNKTLGNVWLGLQNFLKFKIQIFLQKFFFLSV